MKSALTLGILSVALLMAFTSCATPPLAAAPTTPSLSSATVAVTPTSTTTQATATNTATPVVSNLKPLGIIAIGHSGLTGESSDPNRLGQPVPENSWATGTNPAVMSIYQRLLAVEPELRGHVANLAKGGAVASQLTLQARAALQSVPAPQLVIIQTIDNDIRCDGSDDQNVPVFGEALTRALQLIVATSPNSRILMVSQPGRPAEFAAVLEASPTARASYEGNGICDLFNMDGSLNQDHVRTLTSIIGAYEAEQARVCARFSQCSTDGGAFAKYQDSLGNLAGDWMHYAVPGEARLAEIMWPVVAKMLGVK